MLANEGVKIGACAADARRLVLARMLLDHRLRPHDPLEGTDSDDAQIDALQSSYLAGDVVNAEPMDELLGHPITYRIAVGPQQRRKVFTLQTLPGSDPEDHYTDTVGKVAGFSVHAGVAAKADERKK